MVEDRCQRQDCATKGNEFNDDDEQHSRFEYEIWEWTDSMRGPSSITPPTMFGHVYPVFKRFYPRKSVGHDALNEYLRRADRPWYSEATIGRNARSIVNGFELARNMRRRKGTNDDDDEHGDEETMPVRWLQHRKKGVFPRVRPKDLAQVTMHLGEKVHHRSNRCVIDLPMGEPLGSCAKTGIR